MAPFPQAALGEIMTWRRWDYLVVEQKTCLLTSRSVVESSERPTAVVGQGLSGKSRL